MVAFLRENKSSWATFGKFSKKEERLIEKKRRELEFRIRQQAQPEAPKEIQQKRKEKREIE